MDAFWLGFVIGIGSLLVICGLFAAGFITGADYIVMGRLGEKMLQAKEKKGEESDD